MNIAVIPARGGSKRIPGKNIKLFLGKPIIAYSIEMALKCGIFDRVIVTTDSEEIARVARKYGAETPFMRPEDISGDFASTASVINHAIRWLIDQGDLVKYVCCIYATAPFIQSSYLIKGYQEMVNHKCAVCYSVTSFPFSVFRALKVNEKGCLEMIWPNFEMSRSQDLPDAYHDAGQFYWIDCKAFLKTPRLYSDDSRPVFLPRNLVQDIDTTEDWTDAEYKYNYDLFKDKGLK